MRTKPTCQQAFNKKFVFFNFLSIIRLISFYLINGAIMNTLSILIISIFLSGCLGNSKLDTNKASALDDTIGSNTKSVSARIKTVHGDIIFKFYSKEAPNTSKRIQELITNGFYNGLTFHRVIQNFVVQGGDPKGNGTGGSGKNIAAEFNIHKHIPGTVAMARSRSVNSADSQFYISLGTHPHLDNKYTVFGQVTLGLDIAKKIQVGDKMISVNLE
jgi:cyclophilin family peptidyl-prolyl cis-trans isomerase